MSKIIWIGLIIGTTVGGYVPALWGSNSFSISGIVCSTIGGIIGWWIAYRFDQ